MAPHENKKKKKKKKKGNLQTISTIHWHRQYLPGNTSGFATRPTLAVLFLLEMLTGVSRIWRFGQINSVFPFLPNALSSLTKAIEGLELSVIGTACERH